ncbi:MAG: carbohydrate ABC transporter permease, partial [Chthonomonadales bacterium]
MSDPTSSSWLRQILLAFGAAFVLLPLVWMIATSLQSPEAASAYPPNWLPTIAHSIWVHDGKNEPVSLVGKFQGNKTRIRTTDGSIKDVDSESIQTKRAIEPRWENYRRISSPLAKETDLNFPRFLLNTLVITGLAIFGQVLSCSIVGWGFARLRFPGSKFLFFALLATMMIPAQVTIIPTFIIFRKLGWIDTFLPLIIPAWFAGPFFTFLYRQYFMTVPLEMDEAAKIDGATPFMTFRQVLLPLAKPITVTTAVYTFLGTWNDFFSPMIYLNSDHKRTLSLALARFQGAYGSDVPMVMAA